VSDTTCCAWCTAPADTTDDDGDPCCLACALLPGPEGDDHDELTARTERAVLQLRLSWHTRMGEC